MQLLGHGHGRLLAAWAAAGALAALVPAAWMWRFTVDDAFIAIRYARHLTSGLGWRFNVHGPSTDGVTPLPWPVLLAPFAGADAAAVLDRAKALGLGAWVSTGAALGAFVGRSPAPTWARATALGTMALSVPAAAHAVSGMETALATALATGAVLAGRDLRRAALLAGFAASLRPEMATWAVVLSIALAASGHGADPRPPERTARRCLEAGSLALLPFTMCALVRVVVWGHPAPLALLAKPSDAAHGLAYTVAGSVVTLVPLLVVAPIAVVRHVRARPIVVAAIAHAISVTAVGGDWMPYARLMVPVLPSLVYAAVLIGETAHPVATAVRAAFALVVGILLIVRGGTSGRRVGDDRAALVATARPRLVGLKRIAALDIGWLSAATDADIIDLAGLTDPEVAALPGGHTSKRIDGVFLLARAPDAVLIYAPQGLPPGGLDAWREIVTPRAVEGRLQNDATIARHFAPIAWLPLGSSGAGYVLLGAAALD